MPKLYRTTKHPTSIRLTLEAKQGLELLAYRAGLSQAGWLETLIRRELRREKVELAPEAAGSP